MSKQSLRQHGMVLITGLIFMVVLTLIVVSSMRTTLLEERMAGNARDTDLAFQAAEAALRAGEEILDSLLPGEALPTNPLPEASAVASADAYWRDTFDWSADAEAVTGTFTGVSEAPRFFIEEVMPAAPPLKAGEAITESPTFRVTARGVGGNPSTVVFLQSTYQQQ